MDPFDAFFYDPNHITYEAARDAVIASGSYDPRCLQLRKAEEACQAGDLQGAYELVAAAMPGLMLSANAHLLLAFIFHQAGDVDRVQTESQVATLCVQAIMQTGDGSDASPLVVLYELDLLDVCEALQKAPARREALRTGREKIVFEDGDSMVFDTTDFARASVG